MNVSSYVPDLPFSPYSIAQILWRYYIDWLWNYEPNSWVARIAYTSRVLAFLIISPLVVLSLLDVSAYVVARTLGVVDEAKASTTDKTTPPSILIHEATGSTDTPQSDSFLTDSDRETRGANTPIDNRLLKDSLSSLGVSQPQAFFASDDENLKLSGVGVFSPATSRPPSPVLPRKRDGTSSAMESSSSQSDEGVEIRRRSRRILESTQKKK